MRVSIAIQHHPTREALLSPLLDALAGASVEVVTDPDPEGRRNPWRTYRQALETTPEWATHRLIIQDDATPCRDFPLALTSALEARPDRMVALCVCGEPTQSADRIREACWDGWAWALLDQDLWIPAIAVVWPVRVIGPALAYVDEQDWPETFTADDEIIGRMMRHLHEPVLATVPSLIGHDDTQGSVGRHLQGSTPGRVTACPMPPDCDPLLIDWTTGPA